MGWRSRICGNAEVDQKKRQQMVWEIDRQLQEDIARPIISNQMAAGCWHPYELHHPDQQHLQRLALRGRLARPLDERHDAGA